MSIATGPKRLDHPCEGTIGSTLALEGSALSNHSTDIFVELHPQEETQSESTGLTFSSPIVHEFWPTSFLNLHETCDRIATGAYNDYEVLSALSHGEAFLSSYLKKDTNGKTIQPPVPFFKDYPTFYRLITDKETQLSTRVFAVITFVTLYYSVTHVSLSKSFETLIKEEIVPHKLLEKLQTDFFPFLFHNTDYVVEVFDQVSNDKITLPQALTLLRKYDQAQEKDILPRKETIFYHKGEVAHSWSTIKRHLCPSFTEQTSIKISELLPLKTAFFYLKGIKRHDDYLFLCFLNKGSEIKNKKSFLNYYDSYTQDFLKRDDISNEDAALYAYLCALAAMDDDKVLIKKLREVATLSSPTLSTQLENLALPYIPEIQKFKTMIQTLHHENKLAEELEHNKSTISIFSPVTQLFIMGCHPTPKALHSIYLSSQQIWNTIDSIYRNGDLHFLNPKQKEALKLLTDKNTKSEYKLFCFELIVYHPQEIEKTIDLIKNKKMLDPLAWGMAVLSLYEALVHPEPAFVHELNKKQFKDLIEKQKKEILQSKPIKKILFSLKNRWPGFDKILEVWISQKIDHSELKEASDVYFYTELFFKMKERPQLTPDWSLNKALEISKKSEINQPPWHLHYLENLSSVDLQKKCFPLYSLLKTSEALDWDTPLKRISFFPYRKQIFKFIQNFKEDIKEKGMPSDQILIHPHVDEENFLKIYFLHSHTTLSKKTYLKLVELGIDRSLSKENFEAEINQIFENEQGLPISAAFLFDIFLQEKMSSKSLSPGESQFFTWLFDNKKDAEEKANLLHILRLSAEIMGFEEELWEKWISVLSQGNSEKWVQALKELPAETTILNVLSQLTSILEKTGGFPFYMGVNQIFSHTNLNSIIAELRILLDDFRKKITSFESSQSGYYTQIIDFFNKPSSHKNILILYPLF